MSDDRPQSRPPLASFERGWKAAVFLPDPALSFPAVFARRVADCPSETAFTVVKAKGRELHDRSFSWGSIDRRVRRAASLLHASGITRGERVILSLAHPERFLVWFLASHVLGAIPVPLPPASEYQMPAAFRDRIRSVLADCAPAAIVVESIAGWSSAAGDLSRDIDVLNAGSFVQDRIAASEPELSFERSLDEIAFIQYTSGSTGEPKGVVVDHYNLIANLRASAEGAAFGPDDRSFSWLPMFHDMGLIGGLLHGLYMKTAVFVMAPRYFVLRPDSWLRAVHRYRATYTVAPNFAYSLVARRLPESALLGLDLSALRLAFDGAEPIDRDTAERFASRLEPYGFRPESFYPVYGLAECTLAAAFPSAGAGPSYDTVDRRALSDERRAVPPRSGDARDTLHIISVGQAVPGHRVRVLAVDGDEELPERQVGELVISGPSVTRGYWGKPPRASGDLRTGDLGYLSSGELYVVDRLKDLVIVAGRNLVPTDVERVVGEIEGVMRGAVAALGVPGADGTEALVLVAAVDPRSWRGLDEIRDEIRHVVNEHFNVIAAEVAIVAPGSIPKTSSGKVQRAACRTLYEANTLAHADGMLARAQIKARHVQRRVTGLMAARYVSDFPPAAEDTLPPQSDQS